MITSYSFISAFQQKVKEVTKVVNVRENDAFRLLHRRVICATVWFIHATRLVPLWCNNIQYCLVAIGSGRHFECNKCITVFCASNGHLLYLKVFYWFILSVHVLVMLLDTSKRTDCCEAVQYIITMTKLLSVIFDF